MLLCQHVNVNVGIVARHLQQLGLYVVFIVRQTPLHVGLDVPPIGQPLQLEVHVSGRLLKGYPRLWRAGRGSSGSDTAAGVPVGAEESATQLWVIFFLQI